MPKLPSLPAALCLLACGAQADPGYYVVTPYDNEGLRIVDFRYWTVKPEGRGEVKWPELGLGYGVNSRWTTELYMSWVGSSQEATHASTLNWQNDVLLTQGEWPVDVALHLQLVNDREYDTKNTTLEIGPVLQTDVGRTQLNANLFFERQLSGEDKPPTQLKYQWQLRHRWTPGLHFGLQGFGELGPWKEWSPADRQSHRAGPALFGTWHLQDRQAVKLQAAWLEGKTYGHRGHMFTMRLHTEF